METLTNESDQRVSIYTFAPIWDISIASIARSTIALIPTSCVLAFSIAWIDVRK